MPPRKLDLAHAFGRIKEPWSPAVAADVNETQVKLAKLHGEFVWHAHPDDDELFLVVRGCLTIRFRDGDVLLEEGQLLRIPAGVEHQPVAREECHVLLVERASTVNTGDAPAGAMTREALPRLDD